ncbi:hypothetical protein [Paenibacillus planticolens]|uniref:Uncharacterized protein n=1 Tax=Paenibacillus planticolens TaxID=2654976 RepID=A0ABX1ZMX0_9BACL|nr:hypothetical protein [Paenibacillus planticolens]NOV00365.1 hypothetical protein [Paenibacillus planticolens]
MLSFLKKSKTSIAILLVFVLTSLVSIPAFAHDGQSGYQQIYEKTEFGGLYRMTVSNVHYGYLGPKYGSQYHQNINLYVAGANVLNIHVWKDGNCYMLFESKTNKELRACGVDNLKSALESFGETIKSALDWVSLATIGAAIAWIIKAIIGILTRNPALIAV